MLKINIKKIAVFFTVLCLGALVIVPAIAATYDCKSICATLDTTEKPLCEAAQKTLNCDTGVSSGALNLWGGYEDEVQGGLGNKDPQQIAISIINVILGFLGIIAVLIILIGGFKWMTAGGNEEQVGEAKKWIYSGVIGLFIILASYGLAKFAITQLLKATGGTASS